MDILIGICFGIFLYDLVMGTALRRQVRDLRNELAQLKREVIFRRIFHQ